MASPHSPVLDRSALSHVLGLESLASTAALPSSTTVPPPPITDDDMKPNAQTIEDRSKNMTSDNTDTDKNMVTDKNMDKDSGLHRYPSNNDNIDDETVVAVGNGHDGVLDIKTASTLLPPLSSSTNATTPTSRLEGLHEDLFAVDSAHHKDFATSECSKKRKTSSDLVAFVVSQPAFKSDLSSTNVPITLASTSASSLDSTTALSEPIVAQNHHSKRIKADHVGLCASTPCSLADPAALPACTYSSRERKHKMSDDLGTPIMSGTSTPGRHSASPSHSAISVSTPSSSIPTTSVSPTAAPGSGEQDLPPKRPRVYNVDEGSDIDISTSDQHRCQDGPIVINDDDDEEGSDYDAIDDGASNQADYNDSFIGHDDPIQNLSMSMENDFGNGGLSPAHSIDSDATVTQSRFHAAAANATAAARASSVEQQAEPATSPRQEFSRGASPESHPIPSQSAPTILTIDDDPDNEEIIEVIDLTPQPRTSSYPRGDSLPRVPGLSPQHSFQLPTLQRLVSRSSQSIERSQTRTNNRSRTGSIDILEIPDDNDDEEDDDFYGRNTVRIDSEVREVQLDPRHPWSRGPIQLILPTGNQPELEDNQRPHAEEIVDVDDHLPEIDYAEIESDSEDDAIQGSQEVEDNGVNDEQVIEEVNYILSLRRDSTTGRVVSRRVTPMPPPGPTRQRSFPARSPPSFNMRSPSYEAQPITFPTTSRRSVTPLSQGQHRYSPVARRPSPVRLILRDHEPRSSTTSSTRSSSRIESSSQNQVVQTRNTTPNSNQTKSALVGKGVSIMTSIQRERSASAESNPGNWVSQHLKCSICMDTMNVPTMLRCGHAFCRACIHMALRGARHCPMCRQPTTKTRLQELEFHIGGGSSHPVGATSE
ncbi:hypothetical protein FBU30_000904 [Linnemannia zychae]|nr:hypothetical protein FBU30_000904 [Linnemannia zychae]